ncbi:thiamine phosphate synthase [Sphingosinithalassobacter tenebrarum]|uniref:Thiamine phosphate synthase n=2 Tax=Stakelama tenebrarum TaxID=2711215 RepID=A0A6G6Y9U8_9SPHN|nr:thiamine phosphate synthase [Sphingosinithalassobacter tenebrarum]
MGDSLWQALERLPRGSGVVFRHYDVPPAARRRLFARVAAVARRRRLLLIVAGPARMGRKADGVHGDLPRRRQGIRTVAVHDRREAVAAMRAGADAVFVSPVFPTRSHPGAAALGRVRTGLLIRDMPMPVIALGGMNERRARGLRALGIYRWAGIDAWRGDQKRKAVPI